MKIYIIPDGVKRIIITGKEKPVGILRTIKKNNNEWIVIEESVELIEEVDNGD